MPELRPSERPARILHAPWNVGGNPYGLSRGERELGFHSDVMVFRAHEFGYREDIDLGVGTDDTWESRRKRLRFLLWALRRYDVFHFNFGYTIMTSFGEDRVYSELPLLRRLGKTILATFQGDDARPPADNPWGPQQPSYLEWAARYQHWKRGLLVKYSHRCFFLNPDLRRYLPGAEFRPYANIDPWAITPSPVPDREKVVVAHAPSHRGIKGTDHVIAAVDGLRAEGLPIELDLIEGVSNEEALARVVAADLAVDQLNIGWYGGFAVECMALGRPVVSHIREDSPEDNPFGNELPIVRADPASVRDRLRDLVADRERLRELGRRGREFVERAHDPREVARRNLEGLVAMPDSAARPDRASRAAAAGA